MNEPFVIELDNTPSYVRNAIKKILMILHTIPHGEYVDFAFKGNEQQVKELARILQKYSVIKPDPPIVA